MTRFTREWLAECRRLLRKDGTIWVIGTYHNIFRIGAILQELGFWILNDVVWRKSNPMPNFRGRRFTNAHETLIWAARGAGRPLPVQLPGDEGAERRRADAQRLVFPAVHRRGAAAQRARAEAASDAEARGAAAPGAAGLHRPGDIVLDPFLGTGTTAAVAKRLRRHYIGIERHPAYVEAALGPGAPGPPGAGRRRWRRRRPSATCRACRSAAWWSGGWCRPGTVLTDRHAPGAGGGGGGRDAALRRDRRARSTRWARRCRTRHRATAGRSGISSGTGVLVAIDGLRQVSEAGSAPG